MNDNAMFVWHPKTPLAKGFTDGISAVIEAGQKDFIDPAAEGQVAQGSPVAGTNLQRVYTAFTSLLPVFPLIPGKGVKSAGVKERITQNTTELKQLTTALKDADADISALGKQGKKEELEVAKIARENIADEMASRTLNVQSLTELERATATRATTKVEPGKRAELEAEVAVLGAEVENAIASRGKLLESALEDSEKIQTGLEVRENLSRVRDRLDDVVEQLQEHGPLPGELITRIRELDNKIQDSGIPTGRVFDPTNLAEQVKLAERGVLDIRDLTPEQAIRLAGDTSVSDKAILERMASGSLPSDIRARSNPQSGGASPAFLSTVTKVATLGIFKGAYNVGRALYSAGSGIGYMFAFKHAQKIRSLNTPTSRLIADMFTTPESLAQTSKGFKPAPPAIMTRVRVEYGRFMKEFEDASGPVTNYFGKIPAKMNLETWRLLHGFTQVGSKSALDLKARYRTMLDNVHKYEIGAGLKTPYRANFVPVRYNTRKIMRNREGFIKDLIHTEKAWIHESARNANRTAKSLASEITDRILHNEGVPTRRGASSKPFNAARANGPSVSRTASEYGRKLQGSEAFYTKWSHTDLATLVEHSTLSVVRRAEHARAFGPEGEVLHQLVKKVKQELMDAGRPKRDSVIDSMIYDAADAVQGLYGRISRGTERGRITAAVNDGAYTLITLSTMVLVALRSIPELAGAIARHGGVVRTPRALAKGIQYAFIQTVNKAFRTVNVRQAIPKMKSVEYLESIGQISRTNGFSIVADSFASVPNRVTTTFYRTVLLDGLTNMTRVIAYEMMRSHVNTMLKHLTLPHNRAQLKTGQFTDRVTRAYAKDMAEMGFTSRDIAALKDGLDVIPSRVRDAVDFAFSRTVDQTVTHPTPFTRPLWMSAEGVKTVSMLSSFINAFSNVFMKKVFQDLFSSKTLVSKKLGGITAMIGMAYLAYMSAVLTRQITGADDPTEDFETVLEHLMFAAERGGIGGQFSRVLPLAYDKRATLKNRVSRTILGPGPDMFMNLADGLMSGPAGFGKAAAALTPFLNVTKSGREDLAKQYEDAMDAFLGGFD